MKVSTKNIRCSADSKRRRGKDPLKKRRNVRLDRFFNGWTDRETLGMERQISSSIQSNEECQSFFVIWKSSDRIKTFDNDERQ